jgi:hypothetical protein
MLQNENAITLINELISQFNIRINMLVCSVFIFEFLIIRVAYAVLCLLDSVILISNTVTSWDPLQYWKVPLGERKTQSPT